MNELQDINLRDLQRSWYQAQAPERALGHIDRAQRDGTLAWLLRHHSEREVNEPEEIHQRDDVDDLLSFCGLVELASMSGLGPRRPSGAIIDEIAARLRLEPVKLYYERHYPLLLPPLFLGRVEGHRRYVEEDTRVASSLFLRFASLCEPLANDSDVRRFTRLLDDFTLRGGFRRDDLFAVIDDLAAFMDHITRSPDQANALSSACRGFLRFAVFGIDFLRLLEESDACPRLRVGMWEYHQYWFKELKKPVLNASRRYKNAVLRLGRKHRLSAEDLAATDRALQRPLDALHQLCDDNWGQPLIPVPNPPHRTPDTPLSPVEVAAFISDNESKIREMARTKLRAARQGALDSQDVFASVARRLDSLANSARVRPRSEAELWALVRCVTTNTAIEKVRLVSRAQALVSSEGKFARHLLRRLEACGSDDEATLLVHRMALCLSNAEDRQILFLLLRGASFPAIAAALGRTESSIRNRWSRLRHELKQGFEQGFLDG